MKAKFFNMTLTVGLLFIFSNLANAQKTKSTPATPSAVRSAVDPTAALDTVSEGQSGDIRNCLSCPVVNASTDPLSFRVDSASFPTQVLDTKYPLDQSKGVR
jgi:hypothetical protein